MSRKSNRINARRNFATVTSLTMVALAAAQTSAGAQQVANGGTPTTAPPNVPGEVQPPAPPEAGEAGAGHANDAPELPFVQKQYGVSEERARQIVARQAEMQKVADEVATVAKDSWAGAWIDPDGVTLRLATSSDSTRRLLEAGGLPDWAIVVGVRYSMAQLDELHATLDEKMRSAIGEQTTDSKGGTADPQLDYVSSTDVMQNRVTISAGHGTKAAEAAKAIVAKSSDSPVSVVESKSAIGSSLQACPTTNCYLAGAGLELFLNTGQTNTCTTGFAYYRGGLPRLSTAGHCLPIDDGQYRHGSAVIGSVNVAQDSGSVDASIIAISDPAIWKASNLAYTTANQYPVGQRGIVGKQTPNSSVIGQTICIPGTGSLYTKGLYFRCGTLQAINDTFINRTNQGRVTIESCGGDSGGGFLNPTNRLAFGQLRGASGIVGNCGNSSYFSWVTNIETALGASLMTTPPTLTGRNIKPTNSGKCLDVDLTYGGAYNGARVQQWQCVSGTANQRWNLTPVGTITEGTIYSVATQHTGGRCIDMAGPSQANGALAQTWDCLSVPNQRFLLRASGNGIEMRSYYELSKCLDVPGASTANGTQLQQYDCNNTPAQAMAITNP